MLNIKQIRKMLNKEEDFEVEFKESLSGLESEDIVSFANSEKGGTILIGVKDTKNTQGRQIGTVVGCMVGDEERLKIYNKANSCRPPVTLELSSLDIDGLSIYVIEIPNGLFKPYCTSGGTYTIRGDGQKKALLANELLSLFMESEKSKFIASFQEATKKLENDLVKTQDTVVMMIDKISASLEKFEKDINSSLDSISRSAENAEFTSRG
jgi:predicted HTH transcriptional regulator